MPAQTTAKPKTKAERASRVAAILKGLDEMYPGATCALLHRNPWELLVATILSAQCTDKRVNEVTPALFAKYPTPRDFAAVRPEVLANDIRSTGFFNNKAKSIVGAARKVIDEFGGEVPRSREALVSLPGVGRKTANVVLNIAFGEKTIAVDTHLFRVSNRIPLARGKTPEEVEKGLLAIVPDEYLLHTHHWLILHGRYVCKARKPACPVCLIADLCAFTEKTPSA